MIKLREYQNEARYQVNTLLNGFRDPLLVMPTGTGKTKTATVIIEDRIELGNVVIVLTPQEEIFTQWLDDLSMAGLNPGYINQEGIRGDKRKVYVCMPLSLINLLPYLSDLDPDKLIIITDEAHHSAADTWESIYSHFEGARRMGLTATPVRTDGKPLGHLYTDIIEPIKISQAIRSGFLAKPALIVPEQYELDIPMNGTDYDTEEQAKQLGTPKVIGDILREYSHVFHGLPVIVACCTYDHAAMVTEKFRDEGWKAEHIHSKLPKWKRKDILRRVKDKKISVLCTVGIGIEGMDIPGLYGLIWLRRTKSVTIYMQFNGRVLRPLPGKKFGIILDPVGNSVIHGLPNRNRKWSLEESEEADELEDNTIEQRFCHYCGVANSVENTHCHMCQSLLVDEKTGGRPQYCRTCRAFSVDEYGEPSCDLGVFDPVYLLATGCESWQSKGRSIPAFIDGEFVVVNDSNRDQLEFDIEQAKRKIEKQNADEKREPKLEEATPMLKARILKAGLAGTGRERFKDTIRKWM